MLRYALFLFCGALSFAADVQVYIFARTDCPITNRYAPELRRIAKEFEGRPVAFHMVYEDTEETQSGIDRHMAEYGFPGDAMRDPGRKLEERAHATIAPEAAVFDRAGNLKYHGRIDDRFPSPGVSKSEAQVHDLEDAVSAVLAGKPVAHAETRAVGCSLIDLR